MPEQEKKDLRTLLEEAAKRPLTPEQEALRQKMLSDKDMLEATRRGIEDIAAGRYERYERITRPKS